MPRRDNGRTRTYLTRRVFGSQLAKCIRRFRSLRLSPTDGSLCVREAPTCFRSTLYVAIIAQFFAFVNPFSVFFAG